jgi:hypothetical protein
MDSLQFQKAEFADSRPVCAGCKNPIEGAYYQYGGRAICAACSEHVRAAALMPQVAPSLAKPLLYGAGAAMVCSAAYAVITMVTGLELALIAILVGYLVGRAVRIGANGAGARPLQIMAVALTYLSITMSITLSYVPSMLHQVSPGKIAQVLPTIAWFALISPLTNLRSGVSAILEVVIIGVGLMQAWRQTAPRRVMTLTGPFTASQGPSVV